MCLDPANDDRLVSFSIKYANEGGSAAFTLPRVGPAGGTCSTIEAEEREFPKALVIYQDVAGVKAVQFFPRGDGVPAVMLGNASRAKDEAGTFSFGDSSDVIGFYGFQNDKAIRTLGLLARDNVCAGEVAEARANREVSFSSGGDSDDSGEVLLVVLIIVLVSILLAFLIIGITHFATKGKGASARVGTTEMAGTANNSASVP